MKKVYIRVLKNLSEEFEELYPVEVISKVIGVSEEEFNGWVSNEASITGNSWDKASLLAEIHIYLAILYQSKEAISDVLVSDNHIFEETFHDTILSGDIKKMNDFKYYLESVGS